MKKIISIGAFAIIALSCILVLNCVNVPHEQEEAVSGSSALIYVDESAQTGFMSSGEYEARFECMEFPVAGEEEMQVVCRIDWRRYPELEWNEYIVDSFEEGVLFLEKLGEL